jgi:hypothetical protein
MKVSYEEEVRKNAFYDNLGSKYKGELTAPEPFNLTKSKIRSEPSVQIFENKPSPSSKSPSPYPKNRSRMLKSDQKDHISTIDPTNSPNKSPRSPSTNYAKLRIHYTKDKFSEIKVYENTDAGQLASTFCKQYNLAEPMK